jgi:aspartate dehydrogenase
MPSENRALRVALAGVGAVGLRLATALHEGIPGLALAAVSANDRTRARERLLGAGIEAPVVAIEELEPVLSS